MLRNKKDETKSSLKNCVNDIILQALRSLLMLTRFSSLYQPLMGVYFLCFPCGLRDLCICTSSDGSIKLFLSLVLFVSISRDGCHFLFLCLVIHLPIDLPLCLPIYLVWLPLEMVLPSSFASFFCAFMSVTTIVDNFYST